MKDNANHNVPAGLARSPDRPLTPVRPTVAPELGLLNAGGSSEIARAKLEQTFGGLSPLQKLLLSRQLGYDSFGSMLAASTVATLSDGSSWWLTADRYGAWTAWNLCQLDFAHGDGSGSRAAASR